MNKAEKYLAEKASQLFNTSDAFYQWLTASPPDQIVGYASKAKCCPLVGFAESQGFPVEEITFNHFDVSFGDNHSFAVMGVNQHGWEEDGVDETPYWFSDFVQIIDRIYEAGHPVSAKNAIAILVLILEDPLTKEDPEGICFSDVIRLETEGKWWKKIELKHGVVFTNTFWDWSFFGKKWVILEESESSSSWKCQALCEPSCIRNFRSDDILVAIRNG